MIQIGNDKIKEIYYGSDKIKEVYHGSDLVWKMDSGIIQDGYWVHKDTNAVTYFGADAPFINNGVMGRPDWAGNAVEITLPDSLTSIGPDAFNSCSSLTSITLPEGLTSIGNGAFAYCSSLTSITLPNSLTSIEDYAFWGCLSLSLVTSLPTIPPSLGSDAFGSTHASLIIKVPAQSVNAYKAATNWNSYANKISAI